ncbi:ATP-dependent DNA helicase RecG [Elusimicrobium minutum Pei191]|uniref:ATP-dependent DNA helicase RecG n=1 Tax=Elusimicrobium minutum (strain Pei191) TaxID=445932 RepID=B2KB03_ELUMP|nr:ATP-dependent DNA helicase RecG [Elusimicrobium minutum]ACC97762.1 ATP-dependent DNA helicase RecG [Elusimicrobium minutum Pei191]
MDIKFLKGVGPARAAMFERLGINTVSDILRYYPRTYQDRRPGVLNEFCSQGLVVFLGRVARTQSIPAKSVHIFKAFLEDDKGNNIECTWFKKRTFFKARFDPMGSLKKDFKMGVWVWVIGKREDKESFISNKITVEEYYSADKQESLIHVNRLTPVYSLTQGLTGKFFRTAVHFALEKYLFEEHESLPVSLVKKRSLLGAKQALKAIHFPSNTPELDAARKRLVYEEFLLLTSAWGIKKQQKTVQKNYTYHIKTNLLTPFKNNLGFELTHAQKKVINEIFKDMQSTLPMTRLLQGDVGSGKTTVALSAMLLAVENKFQAALMAPTEILAEQHFITITNFLKGLDVKTALLTSSVKGKTKEKLLADLAEGKIDILVGTHSIIEDNVVFKNLKMTVVDEQHRFGVEQRTRLRNKAKEIDMLTMTATPIPRTLALAFYGDLEVSAITELPPGRKPITTFSITEGEAYQKAKSELEKGRQVYIVYPLIEESEKLTVKAVKEDIEKIEGVFAPYKVGMLHGQMKRAEKEKAMADFKDKKTDVLVATPVIEVGIDVKNATVMVIQSAERFGLASLHQLRGRVGRGSEESFCLLVPHNLSTVSKERIDILCQTTDGFKIGERDMQLRGPGEILGTRQSGDFEFKAGDIFKDQEVLKWAIEDRDELLTQDPKLILPEHALFKERLIDLYQKHWHLIDLS